MKTKGNNFKEKQLKQKLSNIRTIAELKEIYKNVEQQNHTLREDALGLRYKVDLLQEKQKAKNTYNAEQDSGKEKDVRMYKIELKEQYKIMQELKKRKEQLQGNKGSEELGNQQSSLANQLKTIDNSIAEVKIEVNDIKRQSNRLQKTLGLYEQQDKRNQPKINEYSSQNSLLRKKIQSLNKMGAEKEHQSGKIMNSMYSIKLKVNQNQKLQKEMSSKKLAKTDDKLGRSKSEFIDVEALTRQVSGLKEEYHRREEEYNRDQRMAQKRKLDLLQDNKDQVVVQKELDEKKSRLQRQLNKYKRIWEKYIQYKNNSKFSREFIENPLQVDEYVSQQEPLRRQFAGVIGGKIKFDDRIALKDNRKSFMTGFIAYELENNATSKNNLVAVRAIYDDPQASQTNQIPIPGQFLSKCKMLKYQFMEGDFIKLIKVKYNATDSRILKIQIRTNKNNRYEFGDKRLFNDLTAGENVYAFDISITEYPVCLFGSYGLHRTHWYLQSLGVEINELEELDNGSKGL